MAKVTHDLDSSGGLMDQIQKLINPPDESRKKNVESHRRGGRVVSKEACDSCGEGGDLLCCDRCFSAFHLVCHDPPLVEDDVPYGEWLCRQCQSAKNSYVPSSTTPPDDAQSTTSSKSNRSNSVASSNPKQRGGVRKKAANNTVAVASGRGTPDLPIIRNDVVIPEDSATVPAHPLSRLARDWRNLNPREFSLPICLVPNDLEPTAPIGNATSINLFEGPGNNAPTSNNNKRQRISTYAATIAAASSVGPNMGPPNTGGPSTPSNSSRRRSAMPIPTQTSGANYEHQLAVYHSSGPPPAKKPILQPDGNVVNLQPLILCYVCSRSCRSAPLLQCDFCPLAFHLDCLETPLATFPSLPWMCPHHPEHYLDVAFAPDSRQSLSKRIRLWRHYASDATIDFNAVKLRFLNKLHRPAPPYRSQTKVVPIGSATSLAHIPQAVKEAYDVGIDPNAFLTNDSSEVNIPIDSFDDVMSDLTSMRRSLQDFNSHLLPSSTEKPEKKEKGSSVLPSVVEAIMSIIDGKAVVSDIASRLDSHTLMELARQRLEQLAPAQTLNDRPDVASTMALNALMELSADASKPADELINEALLATRKSAARALLVPIDRGLASLQAMLPIVSRSVSLGTSPKCAFILDKAAHESGCNRISSLHGVITYDELADIFELLVYSEHGAVVDGVFYGVGLPTTNPNNNSSNESVEKRPGEVESVRKPSVKALSCKCCFANGDSHSAYSFDGPAPLRHGSVIQIGCLRFVFARVLLADVKRVVAEMTGVTAPIECS